MLTKLPVASFICWKSSYSKTSPFAMTGIDNAETTSAISFHFAGSLGLSGTFLQFTYMQIYDEMVINNKLDRHYFDQ